MAPNLLASGADEGEICIWDLAKPPEPNLFPPLKVLYSPALNMKFKIGNSCMVLFEFSICSDKGMNVPFFQNRELALGLKQRSLLSLGIPSFSTYWLQLHIMAYLVLNFGFFFLFVNLAVGGVEYLHFFFVSYA